MRYFQWRIRSHEVDRSARGQHRGNRSTVEANRTNRDISRVRANTCLRTSFWQGEIDSVMLAKWELLTPNFRYINGLRGAEHECFYYGSKAGRTDAGSCRVPDGTDQQIS